MIQISNLCCGYEHFCLELAALTLPSGEISGIIGPNGSGKSTLLKAICGILPISRGSILLNGTPLQSMAKRQRAGAMALVSQQSEIPALSVHDYLLLGRIPHQNPWQFSTSSKDLHALHDAIEQTSIAPFVNRQMTHLSGGERQLCMIARALVQEPSVLLLDEPNTFLDIGHQMQALDLIQRLVRERNLTAVMVLHDLNLASEYSHRLLLLNQGCQVICGEPSEVLTYPHIEAVYGTPVIVKPNPLSGKPHIFMVSAETLQKYKG